MTASMPRRLISEPQYANMIGVTRKTVKRWRGKGYGPTPILVGPTRGIRYDLEEVMQFLESRKQLPSVTEVGELALSDRRATERHAALQRAFGGLAQFIKPNGELDELAIANSAAAEAFGYGRAEQSSEVNR